MSNRTHLYVDGRRLASFRQEAQPTLLMLFSAEDLRERRAPAAEEPQLEEDDDGMVTLTELAAPGTVLRERLDVLGIGRELVAGVFDVLVAERIEMLEAFQDRPTTSRRNTTSELDRLRKLTFDQWCAELERWDADQRATGGPERVSLLMELWEWTDQRFVARAVLEALRDAQEIVLDITEQADSLIEPGDSPREIVLGYFSSLTANGVPVIVLTEGRTDAEVLELTIRVLKPHLQGFLRLPDFSQTRESNAALLVNIVRAFASAGIPNRVIALFDNDTGAAEALSGLDRQALPPNITVLQLPELDLAKSYPAHGPTGLDNADINGRAVSMELFLGVDVLTEAGGQLTPVQWRGYSPRMQRYQGEILDKGNIQERFRAKATLALSDPSARSQQDWTGLELVLESILRTLRETLG
jgi:hypothetical protein